MLVLPVIVVITAILGYPLYKLVTLSFQQYGLAELIQRKGEWIGLDNYTSVLQDEIFWRTPSAAEVDDALSDADGDARVAMVSLSAGVDAEEARRRLAESGRSIAAALGADE